LQFAILHHLDRWITMAESKIEFGVNMKGNCCLKTVRNALALPGVSSVDVDAANQRIVVKSSLPTEELRRKIEGTGLKAVVLGYGRESTNAAVAQLFGGVVKGVVRFSQDDKGACIIDGTIDGLAPGYHGLHVHECGDISQGCESVGGHYNPKNVRHGSPDDGPDARHAGDLGNVFADDTGRAAFKLTDKVLNVPDIIGRALVVTSSPDDFGLGEHERSRLDGNCGDRLACGIIARSAGLFENSKRMCACDGVSIWDERNRPLAGPGRRVSDSS
jgi:copper chaperone for superoxide dismutase